MRYSRGENLEGLVRGAAFRELSIGASGNISEVTVLYQLQM